MDENPNKISINTNGAGNPEASKPIQVMDVRPPAAASSPSAAESTGSVKESPPTNTPSIADASTTSPVDAPTTEPPKHSEQHDDNEHKAITNAQSSKLSAGKLIKILAIVTVALALISAAIYLYMKNQ